MCAIRTGIFNGFIIAMIKATGQKINQLASEKKCGHMGGKVLIPVQQAITNLNAARLAADVSGVSTIIMARTDAESAKLITSDIDPRDKPFIHGERSDEGFFRLRDEDAFHRCVARGLAFAHYFQAFQFDPRAKAFG